MASKTYKGIEFSEKFNMKKKDFVRIFKDSAPFKNLKGAELDAELDAAYAVAKGLKPKVQKNGDVSRTAKKGK